MLNKEVKALKKQSTSEIGLINEALQSYEQNSLHELFQGNSSASPHVYFSCFKL